MPYRRWLGFAIGVAVGLALGLLWSGDPAPTPTAAAPAAASDPPPAPAAWNPAAPRPEGGTRRALLDPGLKPALVQVAILDRRGGELRRYYSARFGPRGLVVVPIPMLRDAAAVALIGGGETREELSRVAAADDGAGLVALAPLAPAAAWIPLPPEPMPLELGQDLALHDAMGVTGGWVSGFPYDPAAGGSALVPVRLRRPRATLGGVLADPDTGELRGLLVGPGESADRAAAAGAGAIRRLLDEEDGTRPLAAWLDEAFPDPVEALWAEVRRATGAGAVEAAVRAGAQLLATDWAYRDRLAGRMEALLGRAVRPRIEAGEHPWALDRLDMIRPLLGDHAGLFLLYGRAYAGLGDFSQARHYLRRAMELGAGLSDEVIGLLRGTNLAELDALDPSRDARRALALVQEAITIDPGFAPYHRTLGMHYFRHGQYAAAIGSLTRAISLDAGLGPDLAGVVDQAYARLNDPRLTHVSFPGGSGVIRVPVRVNGAVEPLQFVLDTGASQVALTRAAADRLNLRIPADAPLATLRTANGVVQAPAVTLRSIDLAGAEVGALPAVVLQDLGGIDGLLGMTYLQHFQIELHREDGYLLLRRREGR